MGHGRRRFRYNMCPNHRLCLELHRRRQRRDGQALLYLVLCRRGFNLNGSPRHVSAGRVLQKRHPPVSMPPMLIFARALSMTLPNCDLRFNGSYKTFTAAEDTAGFFGAVGGAVSATARYITGG